jgi:hypothetical protein
MKCIIDTIFTTDIFKNLLFELFFILISPGIYFHGYKHTTDSAGYLKEISYEVNHFLGLVLFLRLYAVFRAHLNFTKYYSARSNRVS